MLKNRNCRHVTRKGFTILESVVAIMLLSIAAAMVFTTTFPAVNQAYQNRNTLVAGQFADHLLNEMLQLPLQNGSMTAATTPLGGSVFQERSSFGCVEDYNGYSSHACFSDGSSYTTDYSSTEIATLDSICYRVIVDSVDSSFQTGGSAEFARITITAFLDPDHDLAIGSQPPLLSVTHLIVRKN